MVSLGRKVNVKICRYCGISCVGHYSKKSLVSCPSKTKLPLSDWNQTKINQHPVVNWVHWSCSQACLKYDSEWMLPWLNCVEGLHPKTWTLLYGAGESISSHCGLMIYLELSETSVLGWQMTTPCTAMGHEHFWVGGSRLHFQGWIQTAQLIISWSQGSLSPRGAPRRAGACKRSRKLSKWEDREGELLVPQTGILLADGRYEYKDLKMRGIPLWF